MLLLRDIANYCAAYFLEAYLELDIEDNWLRYVEQML